MSQENVQIVREIWDAFERVMPFGALVEELGGEAAMVREYRSWAEALAAAGLGGRS